MLALDSVTAGYGDMLAVRDVSMRVPARSIVAVLGANGAGKSTLCSAIMGTVRVRSGSVRAFGADITKEAVHLRARRGLAYCQEGRRIFAELSVYENLAMGAPLSLGKSGGSRNGWTESRRPSPYSPSVRARRRDPCQAASSRCSPSAAP